MWWKSFQEGKPIREVSGWELQNGGTIVMPYHKNEIGVSHNNFLSHKRTGGRLDVKFGNQWYAVSTHVHTHPQIYRSPVPFDPGLSLPMPGRSGSDLNMFRFLNYTPIHVLYNRRVFVADFYMGRWNIVNHFIW